MVETETFCAGSPLEYAIQGVSELPSKDRRSYNTLTKPIREGYGTDVSDNTADVVKRLYSAVDGSALVEAARRVGLDEVDEYAGLLEGVELSDDEDASLARAMRVLDTKLTYGLAPRSKDAEKVSKKRHRESIYVPELINRVGDGGTVYMAKTLSTTAKVRMAWDLHDENEVVVVNDYDKWESLLGWEKLKKFPHGKNEIREELGDQLSDDVLDIVASSDGDDDDTKGDDGSSSRGRRTRTKPTDEILNLATSAAHSGRQKLKAEKIKEQFEDSDREHVGSSYKDVRMLVLFPTTTDLNVSQHYWIAGSRWSDGGSVAVANCNKGTFEYLADCEEVWHAEDYLSQAEDYEFQTNHGPVTLGTINRDNLVLHLVSEDTLSRLMQGTAIDNMPDVLPDYCEENMYRSPDFPHSDDMLYAPITREDLFWMRPELRGRGSDDGCTLLYATNSPRNIGGTSGLSSNYKLYARARLPEWDFDSTELSTLDGASYSIDLDDGGFELVETLAKLHDNGLEPFSETPQARWSQ
jgi:hypothetical protein